jgi:hypothetical protein
MKNGKTSPFKRSVSVFQKYQSLETYLIITLCVTIPTVTGPKIAIQSAVLLAHI